MSSDARQMLAEARGGVANGSYTAMLIKKWAPLLEGMPDRTEGQRWTMGCMAQLFENESKYLNGEYLQEDTRTANSGSFTKFIFPVLRRVFPNLIANEIVSVQPMSAPIGAVFFKDYIYGTNKGGTAAGNIFPRDFDSNYSSEFVSGEILATGDGVNFGGAGTALSAVLAFNPIRPLDNSRGFKVQIKEINATTGADVQVATDNGTGGFTFSPTGGSVAGAINYANGAVSGFKFQNATTNTNPIKVFYFYDSELNAKIPQAQLDIKQAPIQARSRKLKVLWSAEAAEDLKAFHGIDAEAEMVAAVAQEIALEIDREIIGDLQLSSTGTTSTFDRTPPAGINEVDHLRAMITQISTVSNLIHKKTLRAPANWIVTSPEVSALLAQLTTHADFRPIWAERGRDAYAADEPHQAMAGAPHGQFGIYKAGTLMNKWTVYEDPFFTRDQMLIGLRGQTYMDAGYVWAPYIPLQVTPTFLDPNDFGYRKGLRTRYASKVLRSDYYGQLRILNL